MKKSVVETVKNISTEIAEILGYELVDIEYKNSILTIYIYKKEGISIDDCMIMSREVEKKLDEVDIIEDAYNLEVSSPGADRPLKSEDDYRRNLGREVEVKLYAPREGKKVYEGVLDSYDNESISIKDGDLLINLPIKSISLMRQKIVF